MTDPRDLSSLDNRISGSLWQALRYPGLRGNSSILKDLIPRVEKRLAAARYKAEHDATWIVFIGGTGTGKSSIFNILWGAPVSITGVERPRTMGPVACIRGSESITHDFPFPGMVIEYLDEDGAGMTAGRRDALTVAEHKKGPGPSLVLVDAPDVDSLEEGHRRVVEDLYLLADLVIFIASQEKYADEVPSSFLFRLQEDGKPFIFLLNKADERLTPADVLDFFASQNITVPENSMFLVPYVSSASFDTLLMNEKVREFRAYWDRLLEPETLADMRDRVRARRFDDVSKDITYLATVLEEENAAGRLWLKKLDALFEKKGDELLATMADNFKRVNISSLQREIKKIFSRYDILSKPRRFVTGIISAPLRLLGLLKKEEIEAHRRDLEEARRRIDVTPILAVVDDINRQMLETFSPDDEEAPLYHALRQPALIMASSEIEEKVRRDQEELARWLEETFERLSKGIPKIKELGIYSTSLLWGTLIVTFEVVLGGGLGFFEATLDSLLAPFITKGSVELFAHHEIRKVARELDALYREGILGVLDEQKKRYETCLASLLTADETLTELRSLGTDPEQGL